MTSGSGFKGFRDIQFHFANYGSAIVDVRKAVNFSNIIPKDIGVF